MITLAFANATLREMVLIKSFDELRAHQVSTVTLIFLCTIYVFLVFRWLGIRNSAQALTVGFIWVLLTIAFEFALGKATGKSWEYLFRDYNIAEGHIWPVFLVWLFFLPLLVNRIKNRN